MVTLYNSLTRQKSPLVTRQPKVVDLYVCGVTVYDHCHIGHARTYLAFDVIIRFLRHMGYDVNYVRNITDIDDKIIKRAQERKESTEDLVAHYTEVMYRDFDALGILRPDVEPKATESIEHMQHIIQSLIDQDMAYAIAGGDVYYRVKRFENYGCLSGQSIEDLSAGARVAVDSDKEDPLDFVLWKAAKPGEPSWPSPWGEGRPGWHIECSAMSHIQFGMHFDIHGGGSDLKFPHHENEIAQSEAAYHESYARQWVHTGMVQVNAEKMSKSLGNFFTISQVLEAYPAEVVRYFLICGHYRSEINYSDANLNSAKAALTRLYTVLRNHAKTETQPLSGDSYNARFEQAMADDFNTPEALAVLFDLARYANTCAEQGQSDSAASAAQTLKNLAGILGFLEQDPNAFLQGPDDDAHEIEEMIEKRNQARTEKNWAMADQIRDALQAQSIELEDTDAGTVWRKV